MHTILHVDGIFCSSGRTVWNSDCLQVFSRRVPTSSAKSALYPNIAMIPTLESQHGDPDHSQN